jgi:hypothetical protein
VQEHLTGEDDENVECPPEVASVLCLQSDGSLSFPKPSNKSHYHMTNIPFDIFKFLISTNVATDVGKLCSRMTVLVASIGGIVEACTPICNGVALCISSKRGRSLYRMYLDTSLTLVANFRSLTF